jgi:hypothetical protein
MRRFIHNAGLIICLVAVGLLPSVSWGEMTSRIFFKDGRAPGNYELISRARSEIKAKSLESMREMPINVSAIKKLQFQFDYSPATVDKLNGGADYKEIAALLWKDLRPTFDYFDLPCEGLENLSLMVTALYWAGEYDKITEVDREESRLNNKPLRQTIDLYKLLTIISQRRLLVAEDELKKIEKEQPALLKTAPYVYAQAELQLSEQKALAAQKTIARLIVDYPKDFEWMPPALLLSARTYYALGNLDVASQILEELRLAYPMKHWTALAVELQKLIESRRALLQKEAPAAEPEKEPELKDKGQETEASQPKP